MTSSSLATRYLLGAIGVGLVQSAGASGTHGTDVGALATSGVHAASGSKAAAVASPIASPEVDKKITSPLRYLTVHASGVQKLLARSPGDTLPPRLREPVSEMINAAFDFHELSRLTLGAHWIERTPEERAEFVSVYRGIVEKRNFDSFVKFYREGNIQYLTEEVSADKASVDAQIPVNRELVDITYRLHRIDDRWRIYDLVIDDVSTAEGNRKMYSRYLAKHSYAELVDRLKVQLARLGRQD
jgi:phospholipid transport system substrate-binding protein